MLNDKDAMVDSSATEEVQDTQAQATQGQGTDSPTVDNVQADPSQQQDAKEGAAEGKEEFVPKANVEGEVKRRLQEQMNPLIQQAVDAALARFQSQPNQRQGAGQVAQEEPKYKNYSKSQLETILAHPEATEQDKLFATRGLGVLEAKEETLNTFRSEQAKITAQSSQQKAMQRITTDYPTAFNPNTGTWNYADPVFQRAMQVMSEDPRLNQFGNEGLLVALDRAYARMAREGLIEVKKKETKINLKEKQVQKLQSKAMSSGGQQAQQAAKATTLSKMMDELKKTPEGTPRYTELRTAVFKAKGLIPSFD